VGGQQERNVIVARLVVNHEPECYPVKKRRLGGPFGPQISFNMKYKFVRSGGNLVRSQKWRIGASI
jgi:hypothetical protein